jgi:hypothetical protein
MRAPRWASTIDATTEAGSIRTQAGIEPGGASRLATVHSGHPIAGNGAKEAP